MTDEIFRTDRQRVEDEYLFKRKSDTEAVRDDGRSRTSFKEKLARRDRAKEKEAAEREKPDPFDMRKGEAALNEKGDLSGIVAKDADATKGTHPAHLHEGAELAGVNPLAGGVSAELQGGLLSGDEGISKIPQVQAMIDQLQKEMKLLERGASSETTVTLGANSLFGGAQITLTKFSTDPTSFNLNFSNLGDLGAQAQTLLNNPTVQSALIAYLKNNGYLVNRIESDLTPFSSKLADIQEPRGAQKEYSHSEKEGRQGEKGRQA
ncbi:MAG: hypothetical protein KDK40_02590 [Chlamydiia bacterium]|nr:hypothetical protein [Chlamydiia bacterium]